jgi:CubicO group peptidase (beta-lactamase class C family)
MAIVSGAFAKSPAPVAPAPVDSTLRLDAVLESVRLATGVPGLAAAVVEHGRLIAIGAAGVTVAGTGRALTVNDPLHIGSCTKSMTALAIARLVEQRRIPWSTTLADAFPELMPEMLPPYRHVRLDQLLTHRGGIPPYEQVNGDTLVALNHVEMGVIQDRHAFVRRVVQEGPVHEDGARYDYSNAGYTLAASMMENLTGKTWEYWMEELVFSPLGLKSAGFGWPADAHHRDLPRGHRCADSTSAGVTAEPLDTWYRLGPVLSPGGDVHLSIADLARYAAFQLDGAEGRATKPALKAETWRRLQEDPDGALPGYAMGWQVQPGDSARPVLSHDGTAGTFYARILLDLGRDRAVVIATNAGPPCGQQAISQGVDAVLKWVQRLPK